MKNISLVIFSVVTSFFIAQQTNATNKIEDITEGKETFKKSIPLNLEAKEIMEDVLALDKVWKKAELSKKQAPESDVLSLIEKNSFTYIKDLEQVLPEVLQNENSLQRKELVSSVHQKNNPFFTMYY